MHGGAAAKAGSVAKRERRSGRRVRVYLMAGSLYVLAGEWDLWRPSPGSWPSSFGDLWRVAGVNSWHCHAKLALEVRPRFEHATGVCSMLTLREETVNSARDDADSKPPPADQSAASEHRASPTRRIVTILGAIASILTIIDFSNTHFISRFLTGTTRPSEPEAAWMLQVPAQTSGRQVGICYHQTVSQVGGPEERK